VTSEQERRRARRASEQWAKKRARQAKKAARAAQSITDPYAKASALIEMVEEFWVYTDDHGVRLVSDAEQAAWSIPGADAKASTLARLAIASRHMSWDRSETVARSIPKEEVRASTLARLALETARIDPGRSDRIAQSITVDATREQTLAELAKVKKDRDAARQKDREHYEYLSRLDPSWASGEDMY
jgi:hypothetical protein